MLVCPACGVDSILSSSQVDLRRGIAMRTALVGALCLLGCAAEAAMQSPQREPAFLMRSFANLMPVVLDPAEVAPKTRAVSSADLLDLNVQWPGMSRRELFGRRACSGQVRFRL